MRHKIKLKFVDSIWGASIEETLVYKLLAEEYDIELSNDDPDYLIDGGLGEEHWKYNDCVKICFVGENVVPDFNAFDYAIGFDYLSFEDRYIRIPLYAFYDCYTDVVEKRRKYSDEQLLKRDFCSFVVSNNSWASPKREYFFHELSKYKRVDSGGRHLNNIGEPGGVKNKLDFCQKYKFNIAFENSSSPGYTTEKILEPLSVSSIPIYWGNPFVTRDFNPEAFVYVNVQDDIHSVISRIIQLDKDDAAYLRMVRANPFASEQQYQYREHLRKFLYQIIEKPKEIAIRRNMYGEQAARNKRYARIFLNSQLSLRQQILARLRTYL